MKGDPLPQPLTDEEVSRLIAYVPLVTEVLAAGGKVEVDPKEYARLAATLAELAGLRQDALRWRAVRDDLAVDGDYGNGRWRIVGNNYTPYSGPRPIPATIDEAADRLGSRSGVRKEEKA